MIRTREKRRGAVCQGLCPGGSCYNGEDYESGALHHVVLGLGFQQPLAPATTYYYRCGDPNLAWSHEYTFRTSPLVGVASLPYTCAGPSPCPFPALRPGLPCLPRPAPGLPRLLAGRELHDSSAGSFVIRLGQEC